MRQEKRSIIWILAVSLGILTGCGKNPGVEDLNGRSYYASQSGYSCTTQFDGKTVPSYKDSIKFNGQSVCRTGDACNDFVVCAKPKEEDIKVDPDLAWVEYSGVRYTYSSDPPAQ